MKTLILIGRSMRPKQWTKNAVVLAPLIFAHKAGDSALLGRVLLGAVVFSLMSSATYMVNDLLDRDQDRNHPTKRFRPIISGDLSTASAVSSLTIIAAMAIIAAFMLEPAFAAVLLGYLGLSLAYSLLLKKIVIMDVMTIAMGFVLRVAGGAVLAKAGISQWLFLCTILLALFLGFGKRRHELILLEDKATEHRKILREYSPYFLDQMMAVVTASTVVIYSLYTISSEVAAKLGTSHLYLTIPFVLYGIFRYLYLIHQREEGGSPSSILLTDKPLLATVILWALTVVGILYWSHL